MVTPSMYVPRRNYPPAFGSKMVEAAEGHGAAPDAITIVDVDPILELAIFNALDWSDMWDDVSCSAGTTCTCFTGMFKRLVLHPKHEWVCILMTEADMGPLILNLAKHRGLLVPGHWVPVSDTGCQPHACHIF